ncbi:hypothetical protein [Selenomonas sp. F0473]|uniref:hypothetical protein n=1 Tax=Selenomonas sp. F0473 TaxID=999423 RepID=UPI00029E9E10|nr:hypothetical protein [Selenomonas sp. F0473]EKU71010.1 hypothetical protein HMPREF9161_01104 [Selenomonas sp. F0473]
MKDVLLPVVRRFLRTLAIVTVCLAAMLGARGEIRLIGAVVAGYAAGAAVTFGMAHRVWRSAGFTPARAKREMLWGLALRLVTLFLILSVAAHISLVVFGAAAGGCLLFYALFMLHLIAAQGSQK